MNYVGILIERKDGKMLFQLRDNKESILNPNKWGLFGGGIKEGENPRDAATRELKEELNMDIKGEDLTLIATIPSFRGKNYLFRLKFKRNLEDLKLMEGTSMDFFTLFGILRRKNVVISLRFFLLFYSLIRIKYKKNF